MQEAGQIAEGEERVFRRVSSAATNTVLYLLGGFGILGLAAVGLVIALFIRQDQITLHLMTTLPAILGIGALLTARRMTATPSEVGVSSQGVRVVRRRGTTFYQWNQIGWLRKGEAAISQRPFYQLYDVRGRTLLKLTDAMDGFESAGQLIAAHIAAKPDETAGGIRRRKARLFATFAAVFGALFVVAAGFLAWDTHAEIRAARLLREIGVEGTAKIEEKFLAPNRVTPRIVYRVTSPSGASATRNVEVDRVLWDLLQIGDGIAVRYVPQEPAMSVLVSGEVDDSVHSKNPLIGYGMSCLALAMSLFFIFAAWLTWQELDLHWDSDARRFVLRRFGEGKRL
jgi:hypothetical protein